MTPLILLLLLSLFNTETWASASLTASVKMPNYAVLLRDGNSLIRYRPNASLHAGLKLTYGVLFLQYSTKIPNTNFNNSDVGNDSYNEAKVGLTFSNVYLELAYRSFLGFSSTEADRALNCDFCFERDLLSSRETSAQVFWALDSDFNIKPIVSKGVDSVEPQGSFVLKGFYHRWKLRDINGVIQGAVLDQLNDLADISEIRFHQAGAGAGYAFSWPFANSWHFSMLATVGLGSQENERVEFELESEKKGFGFSYNLKAALTTFGRGFNTGLLGDLIFNQYKFKSDRDIISANYSVQIFTSFVF